MFSVSTVIGINEFMVILTDISVYSLGLAELVIVIPQAYYKSGVPAFHEFGNLEFAFACIAEITD